MITLYNQQFTPSRLYLLKNDKLIVKNKQEDGLIFTFQQFRTKPLKLEEQYKFDCKVGNHYLICEELDISAEVYVFNSYLDRERFQENQTQSEQQFNSDDESDKYDEIMSAGMPSLPAKKRKLMWSTTETSSTYYSKKENQSTTSDVSEQMLPEKRGKRKGSDPVIQQKDLNTVLKPKATRGNNQINNLLQIQQFAKTAHKKSVLISQIEKEKLQNQWETSRIIYEYLINQFSYQ